MVELQGNPHDGQGQGMETCQITGKMVPSGDIVEFHGYRVCAEGKAELLRRLRTGQAMPGNIETPSFNKRLAAFMMDSALLWPAFQIAGGILGMDLSLSPVWIAMDSAHFSVAFFDPRAGLGYFACYITAGVYFSAFHAVWGQSPGKMAAGLVVINMEGGPVGYIRSLARSAILVGPLAAAPLSLYMVFPAALESFSANLFWAVTLLNLIPPIFIFACAVAAFFDYSMQRSIHDRLAGTRVVKKV